MPFQYSTEFRLALCQRLLDGESVTDLAAHYSMSAATLYKWRRQARIDAGRESGLASGDVDELAQARRRIKELEAELVLVKAATELFNAGGVDPKGSTRLSEV